LLVYKKFEFNPFSENTYLVWDKDTLDCALIDPGCYDAEETDILQEFIKKTNLRVLYLLNTHCHLDHVFGNGKMKLLHPDATLIIPKNEEGIYFAAPEQAKMFGLTMSKPPSSDRFYFEYDSLQIGQSLLQVLDTPGHSAGGVSLFCSEDNLCFTGDALFRESIGRTDLPGGNYEQLIASISQRLLALPEKTIILPGHNDASTIRYEKLNNPFLVGIA